MPPSIPANEINAYPNLILVQSLTKRYSIPGLRLGYLISNEDIVTNINRFRIPWSVNTLAIEAGKYILETGSTGFKLEVWLEETKILQHNINALNALKTLPSGTPYFLIKLLRGNAGELTDFLLKYKVLVRDASNFEGLEGEFSTLCMSLLQKSRTRPLGIHFGQMGINKVVSFEH